MRADRDRRQDRRRRGDGSPPLSRRIDRLNGWIGQLAGWLTLVMVLVGAYNAVARYLGRHIGLNLSSNAYIELQWYLFSLVFLLGGAYTLLRDGHVRVDVVYSRLSRRGRAFVDLVGTALLLLPFSLFVLWVSWPAVRNSWAVLESSPDPGGLPRYPIRTVILIAFVLLVCQGISQLFKLLVELRGAGAAGHDGDGEETDQRADRAGGAL